VDDFLLHPHGGVPGTFTLHRETGVEHLYTIKVQVSSVLLNCSVSPLIEGNHCFVYLIIKAFKPTLKKSHQSIPFGDNHSI
jgi:hypothetical protein